jgi:Glycosyltransferases, probably involved in cell wall biogenesis
MERKVSVIIPIYKGNSFISHLAYMLEENWKSVNKIEPVSIEMVLVNDFPDEKLEIKDRLMENISWIEVTNKQNSGIHFSRAQGLLHSSGDYVLFLDQDDIISPVYIREQIAELGAADAIICNGKNRSDLIYRNQEELDRAVGKEEYWKGYNQIVSPGQVLIRRTAIPKEWVCNILKNNGADDYFLWMLMFSQNKKIKIHNKVLYWHLISDVNTSKNTDEMNASVYEMLSKMRTFDYLSPEEETRIRQTRTCSRPNVLSEEKYRKQVVYRQILEMWMVLRDREVTVNEFFHNMGIERIAIYGGGILGKHLYYELRETDVAVVCFMDKNTKADIPGTKTVIPGEQIEQVDAIIITPIMEYEKIREDLRKQYDFEMMSIETVIYNADCKLMMD